METNASCALVLMDWRSKMPNSPIQDPAHPAHHANHAHPAHHANHAHPAHPAHPAHHANPAHPAHHAHPALATFIDDVATLQEIGWLKLVMKETLEINVKN
jgi:hypothetical protein